MTEPRDDIDSWLQREVRPLSPPPGTFELIRKRARRRKARRALVSAASAGIAAAVIVTAIVTLPKVVPSVLHLHTSNPAADSGRATRSSRPHTAAPSSQPATPTAPAAGPPVPANFAATSVTFIGLHIGWVIGQAGVPGHCSTSYCTSMARTDNAGRTWSGLHAPLTGPPDGAAGVGQVRFLNLQNGWAFGPQLWATHDGGFAWTRVPTGGLRVVSLETVGNEAFAVWARCAGTGQDFAADCTQFYLYASPAGSNDWTRVPGQASGAGSGSSGSASSPSSAKLVLTGTRGFLYTPGGSLLSGPVSGTAAWAPVSSPALPCVPGPAQADGQPSGGQFAAATATDLALVCPGSAAGEQVSYASTDGGQTWRQQGTATLAGSPQSLAAESDGSLVVLATSQGIEVSGNSGRSWQQTQQGPAGGFSYAGLTTPSQGVAVPADPGQHAVWFTFDAGQTWQRSAVQ